MINHFNKLKNFQADKKQKFIKMKQSLKKINIKPDKLQSNNECL